MSLVVDEHRQYLADTVRLDAFSRALADVVRPGDTVLDLASGTGILGLLAFRAGAGRVCSIEATGMIEIARSIAAANGLSARWTFFQGYSSDIVLPERVHVVVCDQIGRFGVEVDILQHARDARKLFLKPGGIMVPARVDLVLAPVEAPALFDQVEFWRSRPCGFDVSPARQWAANTGYPTAFSREMLLGPAETGASLDLAERGPSPFQCGARLEIDREGTLHGLAGWFDARLSPGVRLTSSPLAADRIRRRNVYFPLNEAVAVQPGDAVSADLHIVPPKTISWSVRVERGRRTIARFTHSTVHGMLLTTDDLRRTKPASVPVLTPRGAARRLVLDLCDGARTLDEVERELFARHPELFPSPQDAAVFVAEVVTRYTR
jgi:protein arginine N-methyltransferase 1